MKHFSKTILTAQKASTSSDDDTKKDIDIEVTIPTPPKAPQVAHLDPQIVEQINKIEGLNINEDQLNRIMQALLTPLPAQSSKDQIPADTVEAPAATAAGVIDADALDDSDEEMPEGAEPDAWKLAIETDAANGNKEAIRDLRKKLKEKSSARVARPAGKSAGGINTGKKR